METVRTCGVPAEFWQYRLTINRAQMTFARTIPSGAFAFGDNDIYGAQQHLPLYDALVPWDEAG